MKNLIILSLLLLVNISAFSQDTGELTDNRDRQVYKWVRIGNQTWMAENLNYDSGRGSGKYSNQFGRVYNWRTAKSICPNGWHLPSDREWFQLEYYLGMSQSNIEDFDYYRRNEWDGGKRLKSRTEWIFYFQNGNGIDKYGFNALPGGWCHGSERKFYHWGGAIVFWTSSEANSQDAIVRRLGSDYDGISRDEFYKGHGAYCRCIKD